MEINELIRSNIADLMQFSSVRDECGLTNSVLLDANESPYDNGYNRYPDPYSKKLKRVYSEVIGVPSDNLFVGNGSDEVIDLLIRLFCEPGRDSIITMTPSYGMYKISASINNIKSIEVPLENDFSLNPKKVLKALDETTKIIFLCSPNNPTGNSLSEDDINQVIKDFRGLVVVDEAYIDFSQNRGFVSNIGKFENLVVLRTLSKAWGMAGVRVGFGIASVEIVNLLNRVKFPYNVNRLSQEKAVELLKRGNKREIEAVLSERERLSQQLKSLESVVEVYPSQSNFILVKFRDHRKVFIDLINKGVVLRDLSLIRGCENTLRITIGTKSENDLLIGLLNGSINKRLPEFIERVRSTKETMVSLRIDPDGKMESEIMSGIPFIDHMLEQIAVHSGFSMRLIAVGDLENGPHHTIEDIAIVLGDSLFELLSSYRGNNRYGFSLPMDESYATVMVDFGKRAFLQWDVLFPLPLIEGVESDMFRHFFDTLSKGMKASIHIRSNGLNGHHMVESIFKAFAKSLEMIMSEGVGSLKLKSSKGLL
ncbi:MAG: histidinol-phosphate transaminase [Bacteroidales bacterium]|nr:histidinol-phosphate transaminase [Bacteroidales bacterium]